ncbi:MAG: phosphohydrolase [Proteobacteria bacterium]|nr:phosphohydrolase [Pseudomonadota bacterium]
MALSVEDIAVLFEVRGREMYGREAVSQLEHALQCAQLAEDAGAGPELVSACLLHDLGHLLAAPKGEMRDDVDDVHQYFAIPFLRGVFPDAVLEPIRLHVDAKRWLCAAEPAYWGSLSAASKHSLELQGGIFAEDGAKKFIDQPHASEAVLLRRWDDFAKTQGKATPSLRHYLSVLESCQVAQNETDASTISAPSAAPASTSLG